MVLPKSVEFILCTMPTLGHLRLSLSASALPCQPLLKFQEFKLYLVSLQCTALASTVFQSCNHAVIL